ncbi:MAG TPA: nucleotidyltransferase family protein [Terriglobales bacterium]|nr:nucleotidyltransferase family protein [Terriglobales bacterium]
MTRAPSFCGVILAAGDSTRMGSPKALLPWRRGTFLSGTIRALTGFTDLVIVVAGSNAEILRPVADAEAAYLIPNPQPERGQFSSLQVGLQEVLNRGRDAAIITLVDRPPCATQTVSLLQQEFLARIARDVWAVVPEYQGQHGHPYVIGREMIGKFLDAPASATARDIQHANQAHIDYIAVTDPFVIANVDTPEDYQRLLANTPETSVSR